MSPRRVWAARHVLLGLLFVAAGLLLALFANLTSTPVQWALNRLPAWLYLIALAGLLAGGVAATIWYERLARQPGQALDSAARSGSGARPRVTTQPSRRAVAAFGIGAAMTGAALGVTGPRLFSWLASALDSASRTPEPTSPWRRETLESPTQETDLVHVGYSPDGKTLAAGFTSGSIVLWNTESRARRVLFNGIEAYSVAFSPDGRTLAANSRGDSCHNPDSTTLWDIAAQNRIATFQGQWLGSMVAFSPDGNTLACGFHIDCAHDGGAVELWDIGTHRKVARLSAAGAAMAAGAFSPDGKILAAGGNIDDTDTGFASAVALWDTATRQRLGTLFHPGLSIMSVAFSPDGTLLAAGGIWDEIGSEGILLWNVATRENIATLRHPKLHAWSLAFSPDGETLVAALGSNSTSEVTMWSTLNSKRLLTFTLPRNVSARSIAVSPDGETIAMGGYQGDVHLWTKRQSG